MRIFFSLVFLFLLGACAPKATVTTIQEPKVDTIRIDSTPVATVKPVEIVDQQATSDDLNFTYLKAKSFDNNKKLILLYTVEDFWAS